MKYISVFSFFSVIILVNILLYYKEISIADYIIITILNAFYHETTYLLHKHTQK